MERKGEGELSELVLVGTPADDSRLAAAVARALSLPLGDARSLLARVPARLPRAHSASAGEALAEQLRALGATVELVPERGPASSCASHAALDAYEACTRCKAPACSLCVALAAGEVLCASCDKKRGRSRAFFRVRVAVLLLVLFGVALYAWNDVRSRRARHDWANPLEVAVVVLAEPGVDTAALDAFRERLPALEERLASEKLRYQPGSWKPFAFTMFGPLPPSGPAPKLEEDGFFALAGHSYALWRYFGEVDERAHLTARAYASRIYVTVRAPRDANRTLVEGESEQDGRIGNVDVELDPGSVDFALIVVAHELMHTLGATDKYDPQGHPKVPEGLAEPELGMLQTRVEIMAQTRPVAADLFVQPDTLDDVAVGSTTALEIGWIP
jgi:hypothetical protein